MEQSRLSGLSDQPPVRCPAGAVPELWDAMEPLTLVIPTFNEAETIGGVIREIPVAYRLDIIVADVGSTDGTQAVAQAAGARVIDARHGFKEVDLDVLETLDKSAVSYQVVLTKADQVKPAALEACTAATLAALAKHPAAFPEVIVTSSRTGAGMPELRAAMIRLLGERSR